MNREALKISILSALVTFSGLTSWAALNRWTDENGVEWIYVVNSDDTITIGNGYYAAIDGSLTGHLIVPSTVAGRPVAMIGRYAFMLCYGLTKITIPEGIVEIGADAFWGCHDLESVVLPRSLKSVGSSAFYGCDKLADESGCIVIDGVLYSYTGYANDVTISDNVFAIGDGAFEGCYWIVSVTLPRGLIEIGNRAFKGCDGLTLIELPSGVKTIGDRAFDQCNGLTDIDVDEENLRYGSFDGVLYDKISGSLLQCPRNKVGTLVIPQVITSIADDAFAYCHRLIGIEMPSSIVSIGWRAFSGCVDLTSIFVPESVVSLGEAAFGDCTDLEEVRLPSGLLVISNKMFSGCRKLSKLSIPKGVQTIGDRAFEGCRALGKLVLPDTVSMICDGAFRDSGVTVLIGDLNCCYLAKDGALYDKDGSRLIYFSGTKNEMIVPAAVTEIAPYAFDGCESLQGVKMPEGLQRIGVHAFSGCSALKSFTVPSTVEDISNMIARWTHELTAISFMGKPPVGLDMFVKHPADHLYYNSRHEAEWQTAISSMNLLHAEPACMVEESNILVPTSWANEFQEFETFFGSEIAKAVVRKTGKKDGAGNDMFVWQDYVAGTDPTDETDLFTASITIVDGEVRVSYTPELDDARKALRKYTTWGKAKLTDKDWSVVGEGEEGNFNFFKVTVEMK